MKRPERDARPSDDTRCGEETGRRRAEWFKAIDESGASGRAAIGKLLQAQKVDPWWIATLTVDYEAAKGIVEKDGTPKGYSICSTKTVAVAPARAYAAFTTPADLAAWFDKNGLCGEMTKQRPDKVVAFKWNSPGFADGSNVEVLIQPKGDKTGLVVNHTRVLTRRDADDLRAGWESALTALKSHLEGK